MPIFFHNVLDILEDGCIVVPVVNRVGDEFDRHHGVRVTPEVLDVQISS
jgi:hypothetical protein